MFDIDDTLFDFEKAEANALMMTLAGVGIDYQPGYFELYAKFNKQVWQQFERGELTAQNLRIKRFQLFFDALAIETDHSSVSDKYLSNLARGTDLIQDAEEVIKFCLEENYQLALVTNGLPEVQRPRLRNSKLSNYFDKMFISEEMGIAKPSFEYFEHVLKNISSPPKTEVMIIGDSLSSDIKGGIDFGIDTCWFNPKGLPSSLPITYNISKLIELLPILQQ